MNLYEPDEQWFIVRWIFTNLLGFGVGALMKSIIYNFLLSASYIPSNEYMLLLEAGTSIGLGAFVGSVQWYFIFKGRVNYYAWVAANAVAFSLLYVAAFYLLPLILPDFFTGTWYIDEKMDYVSIIADTWLVNVVAVGVVFGLIYGVSYWLVLRRYTPRAYVWIISTTTAGILAFGWVVGLLYIFDEVLTVACLCLCTNPLLMGAVTGGTLYRLLHKEKRKVVDE